MDEVFSLICQDLALIGGCAINYMHNEEETMTLSFTPEPSDLLFLIRVLIRVYACSA